MLQQFRSNSKQSQRVLGYERTDWSLCYAWEVVAVEEFTDERGWWFVVIGCGQDRQALGVVITLSCCIAVESQLGPRVAGCI